MRILAPSRRWISTWSIHDPHIVDLYPWLLRRDGSRRAGPAPDAGAVSGKPIQVSGGGTCGHAPDVSMGGMSASLWTVNYRGSDEGTVRELNLRLLRPKDGGPDQLSFELKSKAGDHRIETGTGRKHKGEGTVTILPSGPGGRLELSGKDTKGKPIQISIDCPTFSEAGAGDS